MHTRVSGSRRRISDFSNLASGEPEMEDEDAFYESVTEKARAILRRENIQYVQPIIRKHKKEALNLNIPNVISTPSTSTTTSTKTQVTIDPKEEEEEILRSLFFPF